MTEYNYPEHDWNTPSEIKYDKEGIPMCKKHNLMLVMNAITLADYCPWCSYEGECNHPQCYCHLIRETLKETGKTIDTWKWKESGK